MWRILKSVKTWILTIFLLAGITTSAFPQSSADSNLPGSKLKVGEKIPALQGTDQFGKTQSFDSLRESNGLVLLFFRSADW